MRERLRQLLGVEEQEFGPVVLLLLISFLMGLFIATVTVASQTQFLTYYDEGKDLPVALVISGAFGLVATALYTFLQGRVSFNALATTSLVVIILITAGIEFGETYIHDFFQDPNFVYFVAFTQILPFVFISQLIFWGSFGRLFNLRQAKRVVGSVDIGVDIASLIAFFSIPFLLASNLVELDSLYTIALASVTGYLVLFTILSRRYLTKATMDKSDVGDETKLRRLGIVDFFRSKYIFWLSLFVIVSITALRFVDYTFFNVASVRFKENVEQLPLFLSGFEATIVVFGILFGTFATDRITADYGLRVSLIINPLLLILFTAGAWVLGLTFGYEGGESMIFFFIMVAMSKLFVNSLKGALDDPVFKMYYIPINKAIKLDAQTKIEGMITAVATMIAGGLIVLINAFDFFDLLSVTLFTVPILVGWYMVTNKMYSGYKDTLQESLHTARKGDDQSKKEYTMDRVLEKEVASDAENKVIYGLKLMEKLEPALFESSLMRLAQSELRRVRQFAETKIAELGFNQEPGEMKGLALQAAGDAEASDLLSISSEKLMKLSKGVKQSDRILAAKLLRKLVSQKTIFILLELLRDQDPKVRNEALLTARRVKRPETWPVLIDLISSPAYSHQAICALKEAGDAALPVLEGAFHKSGQSDLVMLKIIQIMGHIGGQQGLELLWKKVDYPDKRIVKQILYSLRFINYKAKGREVVAVKDLLDTEMAKTMWNLAALDELPAEEPHFQYLRQAIEEETRENYDQITLLLSLLYDQQSVQLVRENLLAATPDSVQYALELLDLFVDQDLKPKLIPLLDDTRTSEKLEKLQTYFPRESYNPVQVINYVLNRDFNYNNRWSKVCAVHASAYLSDFRVSRGLISQLFNQDKLLQETAAWVIFNKDKSAYSTITERIPMKDKRFLDSAIQNNQLLDGLDDGFFLAIEMVLFIKQLPPFKDISGNLLSDLTDKISPIDLNIKDKVVFSPAEDAPILIVAHGEVVLKNGDEEVVRLKKGAVFGDLFQEGAVPAVTSVHALERSIVFKITLHDFYFVLAKHHDLVQGIIRNVTGKKELISE